MASRLVLRCLAAVVALLCRAAVCHGGGWPFCSTTSNYTNGSQFKKNLDELLLTLSGSAARSSWFNTSTVGTGGDQVFGLIMCYADRNATECLDCLAGAPEWTMTLCQGSRNVTVNYDACLLRYSDTRFFAATDLTYGAHYWDYFIVSPSSNATDMETMTAVRSKLMDELVEKAGDRPARFYNYSLPYTDAMLGTDVMSGLAQCTRDLAPSDCNRCIAVYTPYVSTLFPNNIAGSIKGYSCYLRYQLGAIKITPPPAEPATPAMPPSVPAPKSPTPGSKSSINCGDVSRCIIWRLSHRME
jgi:hypothetical protein